MGSYPVSSALGDVNRDGHLDLATANFFEVSWAIRVKSVTVRLGDGQGGFPTRLEMAVDDIPLSIAMGDLDGSRAQDLAVSTKRWAADATSFSSQTGVPPDETPM